MQENLENIAWEHFDHIADVGIRGKGNTKAQALEQIALAMTAVIADLEKIVPEEKVTLHCRADNDETLLYDFLNSVIYEMATKKMLFSEFNISIKNDSLNATLSGQHVNVKIHQPAVEIKAATYTELSFSVSDEGMWIAQCVVDV